MKRFMTIALLVTLFVLLLTPTAAYAKASPGLVLKTTEITMTVGPMSPALLKTPIVFGNNGSAPLQWQLYVGSDFGGCAVEAPVKWLTISPSSGYLKPNDNTSVFLTLDYKVLGTGTTTVLVCMSTNDPNHATVAIPLSVTIK